MLARITANSARRLPRVAPAVQRFYSEDAFHKKEKAHEDQYAKAHEKEQLEKIRKQIEEKKAELARLQAAEAEHLEGKKQ